MSTKRRLTLMPEVLPTPETIAGRPAPRARILERLRQLASAPPSARETETQAERENP
jgi:hypothetical protein